MYIVINFASAGLTIAGVFTTLSNAQQYIGQQSAGQQSAGSFFICQVQSLPGGGPTNIVSPIRDFGWPVHCLCELYRCVRQFAIRSLRQLRHA